MAAWSPLTGGFKVQGTEPKHVLGTDQRGMWWTPKPSSGSLFVKWYCYSSAVVRWFVWPGDSEAFMTEGHSVRILLYIFSSIDGYSCWTLNEFALFSSIKPNLWFTLSFSAVQRKKTEWLPRKLKLPIDIRTVSRWNSFRMMRGLEIKTNRFTHWKRGKCCRFKRALYERRIHPSNYQCVL